MINDILHPIRWWRRRKAEQEFIDIINKMKKPVLVLTPKDWNRNAQYIVSKENSAVGLFRGIPVYISEDIKASLVMEGYQDYRIDWSPN